MAERVRVVVSAAASPPQVDPAWPPDAIEVARIVDAWGVKGGLKIQPFAADPQALFSSTRWFLLPSERSAAAAPGPAAAALPSQLKITQVKGHGELVVAQAREVTDRAGAQALRGARVFVSRSSFPSAGPDEFYWVDLIGLNVLNRQGVALGTVAGLIDTGPHSVLRVKAEAAPGEEGAAPAERLIPFVGAYIDEVSLERRLVTVDWGLDF